MPADPAAAVPSSPPPPSAAPAASAPVPPYDLAADLAQRTAAARERFGAGTRVQVEGAAFLLVDADHGGLFDQGVSLVHRTVGALLAGPFSGPPDRAVTVYLFSKHADYVAFSRERYNLDPGNLYGYYRRSRRELLVDATSGLPTLSHEIVHPFMQHAMNAPAWIDEGTASLLEFPYFAKDGSVHGLTNWRYDRLRHAIDSRDLGPTTRLSALFGMSNHEFLGKNEATEDAQHEAELRHYAMARFVCQWLDSRGALWTFLHAWRDGFATDPDGRAAFVQAVGMSPEDADAPWLAYVRSLQAKSAGAPPKP